MIDFRYHLISIVAVLLSLSLGILVGSGFLGDPLFDDIKKRAEEVNESNDRLLELSEKLRAEIREHEQALQEAALLLLDDHLADRQIVMFVFEGTAGNVVGDIANSVEDAGGTVATTIRITDKFALRTPAELDQLALILRALPDDADALRDEAGVLIGQRAAQVAALPIRVSAGETDHPLETRLLSLLAELQEADYLSFESDGVLIPRGSLFVIVGGSNDEPRFEFDNFVTSLSGSIAENSGIVIAAEPSDSVWELVPLLRDGAQTVAFVATVEDVDTIVGQIALVLGLERAEAGIIDHYGTGPGATQILPEPDPGT